MRVVTIDISEFITGENAHPVGSNHASTSWFFYSGGSVLMHENIEDTINKLVYTAPALFEDGKTYRVNVTLRDLMGFETEEELFFLMPVPSPPIKYEDIEAISIQFISFDCPDTTVVNAIDDCPNTVIGLVEDDYSDPLLSEIDCSPVTIITSEDEC